MLTFPPASKENIQKTNKRKAKIKTNDLMLHCEAFDSSFLPNIISTVKSGKIILANSAACKLLGYSKKELLTKDRSTIFNVKETGFKKMLKQRRADGHSSAYVTAIKKNNKTLSCEVTSAIFLDAGGVERSVTTIADRSKSILLQEHIDAKNRKIVANDILFVQSQQKKTDAKNEKLVAGNIVLAQSKQKSIDIQKEKIAAEKMITVLASSKEKREEVNEWIRQIGKTSFDIMFDWNVSSGEIYVGDSIKEVFGYKIENNSVSLKDFRRCLIPEEKKAVEKRLLKALSSHHKSWNDSFMFKRYDGSLATTVSRASIIRDADHNALRLIGAIQDISNIKELEDEIGNQVSAQEKLLVEFKESFAFMINSSSDVLYDSDLLTHKITISDSYQKEYGYKINSIASARKDWASHIHPEDKEKVFNDYLRGLDSADTHWSYTYRFLKADHTVANVISTALILRDSNGKAYRMVGSMQDVTRQKLLEEKLLQEISLKEKQVEEAMEDARNTERSDIGKELHDNVNQLLGASKLYLDMAKQGGSNSDLCLNRSSEYTLIAIEEIRKLTKGLLSDTIQSSGLAQAIEDISASIMEASQLKIEYSIDHKIDQGVNDQFKLCVFRIIQEQLNNILKHAKATEVSIRLSQNKKSIILSVSDNGVGFDIHKKRMGIGVMNIKNRVAFYHGTADFVSAPGYGCVLCVMVPVKEPLLNKD